MLRFSYLDLYLLVLDVVIDLVFICMYFILWMDTIIEPKSPEKLKKKQKYETIAKNHFWHNPRCKKQNTK